MKILDLSNFVILLQGQGSHKHKRILKLAGSNFCKITQYHNFPYIFYILAQPVFQYFFFFFCFAYMKVCALYLMHYTIHVYHFSFKMQQTQANKILSFHACAWLDQETLNFVWA